MIKTIKVQLQEWDWRNQTTYGDKSVVNILANIENKFYKTRKVILDLETLNLGLPYSDMTLFWMIVFCVQSQKAKLKYPIIIDSLGQIVDWKHRVCKAICKGKGKTKIKAIQILESI